MYIKKIKQTDYFMMFSVVWLILSSSSLFFCMLHMEASMAVLGLIAILWLGLNRKVTHYNYRAAAILLLIILFNYAVNYEFLNVDKNIAIILIRLLSLAVIMSNIDRDQFFLTYVRTLVVLAVISLICFSFTMLLPGTRLPFQTVTLYNGKPYIYTFYHTLGRWFIEKRNCGVFWEPGAFQIFLNLALLILVTKPKLFNASRFKAERFISIVILSITVFTTLSTTGYLCYIAVLGIGMFHSMRNAAHGARTAIMLILALIAFLIIEMQLGIVESKLINQQGSYSTRLNDTTVSFEIAGRRFLTGYGFSNLHSPQLLAKEGVTSNSNGLGSLVVNFGYPVLGIYLIYLYKRLMNLFDLKLITGALVLGLFLLFFMSEPVNLITLFLSFLFRWRGEDKELQPRYKNVFTTGRTGLQGGYSYVTK